MQVIGCVIFYDDGPELLKRCLLSLKGKVNTIIAIDGAFQEFPHVKPWSTDGCIEVAKKYADITVETKTAWKDQASKRNIYLSAYDITTWYFILDTDEYLVGTIPSKLFGNGYSVFMKRWMDPVWLPGQYSRLIRHTPGIHYHQKHNHLISNGVLIQPDDPTLPKMSQDDFIIIHRPADRPISRNRQDGEYMVNRAENAIPYGEI